MTEYSDDDSLDVEMDSRNEERQSDRPYQRQQYWRESPDTSKSGIFNPCAARIAYMQFPSIFITNKTTLASRNYLAVDI